MKKERENFNADLCTNEIVPLVIAISVGIIAATVVTILLIIIEVLK